MRKIQSSFVAVRSLDSYLKQKHVKSIVLSPGSRNAPLILQFTNDTYWEIDSIVDERTAGFFALGQTIASGHPTVLCCTSGSALLNYLPAVAEAVYQDLPLIILSADRPSSYLNHGHAQTINQVGVFDALGVKTLDIDAHRPLDYSALVAHHHQYKVLHINIHFAEPLYDTVECEQEYFVMPSITKSKKNLTPKSSAKFKLKQSKTWVVLGAYRPADTIIEWVKECDSQGMVILSENTTNLGTTLGINKIDVFLNSIKEDMIPEVVVTLQRPLISNRIVRYLREHASEITHINIGEQFARGWNTFDASTFLHLDCTPMLRNTGLKGDAEYQKYVYNAYTQISQRVNEALPKVPFCDLSAIYQCLNHIPPQSHIHWSNSSPIRYGQLVTTDQHHHYANRGVSGIEGSTSTAAGFAKKQQQTTFLITGELSFLYDSNLWWNIRSNHLKVIVLDNQGGDIFRIIPGPVNLPQSETYFTTPKSVDISAIAVASGISYFEASDTDQLKKALEQFIVSDKTSILHIKTGQKSAAELNKFWKAIK